MNNKAHPDTELLVAYAEQPESVERQAIGLHLAGCGQCRKDLEVLSSLRQHAGWISADPVETSEPIADLLQGRLSEQAATELRERIKQDPLLLRQSLHYARHHLAMLHRLQVPEESLNIVSRWDSIKNMIVQSLQFQAPVWKMVPVAVVLVAVVTLFSVVQNLQQPDQLARIVSFEDQPTIQFVSQTPQPGIGFFANAGQTSRAFGGVIARLGNDREIAFSWPDIDGAIVYGLKLKKFQDGESVVLGRVTSNQPNATIKLSEALSQHRYEWVLSGDTIDGQSFQSTGGFVVTR